MFTILGQSRSQKKNKQKFVMIKVLQFLASRQWQCDTLEKQKYKAFYGLGV